MFPPNGARQGRESPLPNACLGLADRWSVSPYVQGMNTPQRQKPAGWFSSRTRLITIVSIVAVGLAGAAAVSANIGILDAASDSDVGTVSAAGDLTPPATEVIDVYLPDQTSSTMSSTAAPAADATGVQEFTVDAAGTVAVVSAATGLRLESVTPATGWTWGLTQTSQTELMVTMTDGVRTLEFVATKTEDGNIAASVNEPIVTEAPPAANTGGDDDDDESEHNDESEDEDEHEGGEDDD